MSREQKRVLDESSDDSDFENSGFSPTGPPKIPSKIEHIRVAESYRMEGRDEEIDEENKTKRVEPARKTMEEIKRKKKNIPIDSSDDDNDSIEIKLKPEVNKYRSKQPSSKNPPAQRILLPEDSDSESEIVKRGSAKKPEPKKKKAILKLSSSDEFQPPKKARKLKKTGSQAVKPEIDSSDSSDDEPRKKSVNIQMIMQQKAKEEENYLESSLSVKPQMLKKKPVYNSKPLGFESKESVDQRFPSSDSDSEPFERVKQAPREEEVKIPPHFVNQISQEADLAMTREPYDSTEMPSTSQDSVNKIDELEFKAYERQQFNVNQYQINRIVKDYKLGDQYLILMCGDVIKAKDVKIYEIEPGMVKCPICGAFSYIKHQQLKKVLDEKLQRNLAKIKDYSKKQNQCQMEDCVNGKNSKYAYIIGKNKVICKDCIFKREGQKLNWIILDHLPNKLGGELRNHQFFFASRAKLLHEARYKIRTQQKELKDFNKMQTKVLNQRRHELEQRIGKNLDQQLAFLKSGKNKFLAQLKQADSNLHRHKQTLIKHRQQLLGVLSELRRKPRQVPTEVKVGLNIEKKIQKCNSLLQSESMSDVYEYKGAQLLENLDYRGMVEYQVRKETVEVNEGIWNTYVGDLANTPKSYEVFKMSQRQIQD